MRIGFDARWIFPEISGIGLYSRELLNAFVQLDRENEFVVFFNNARVMENIVADVGFADKPNFSACLLPYGLFSIRGQLDLPRRLRRLGLDVFHSPNYMIPLPAFPRGRRGAVKGVVTIHDLIPLLFPDFAPHSRKRRLFFIYRRLMREVALRADMLITVSHASRDDITRNLLSSLGVQPPVLAIAEGVSPRFVPLPVKPVRAPDTPRRIFWVGRPDPYKNLPGLLRAFKILTNNLSFPVQLRIAGVADQRYPEAPALARELGIADKVEWLGYIPDTQLVAEYQQADLFVLPSFYEGFGLPVLEAMASGTPVICANCASLPEVGGNAALYVNPRDQVEMAAAMRRILTTPALAADLSARGIARSRRFTWQATAEQTLAAYHTLLDG